MNPYSCEDCCICLEKLDDSIITPCGHSFHINCIKELLRAACPMCNTDIKDFLVGNNILIIQNNDTDEDGDDYEGDDGHDEGDEDEDEDEHEDEDEDEHDYEDENIRKSPKFQAFNQTIDSFFDLCDDNQILSRKDFTCCNTCGCYEIYGIKEQTEDEGKLYYDGYIFYHSQETDFILDQISGNIPEIHVHLNWGLFVDSSNPSKEDYDNFTKKLVNLADKFTNQVNNSDFKLQIKYDEPNGINRKLEMFAKVPEIFNEIIP